MFLLKRNGCIIFLPYFLNSPPNFLCGGTCNYMSTIVKYEDTYYWKVFCLWNVWWRKEQSNISLSICGKSIIYIYMHSPWIKLHSRWISFCNFSVCFFLNNPFYVAFTFVMRGFKRYVWLWPYYFQEHVLKFWWKMRKPFFTPLSDYFLLRRKGI